RAATARAAPPPLPARDRPRDAHGAARAVARHVRRRLRERPPGAPDPRAARRAGDDLRLPGLRRRRAPARRPRARGGGGRAAGRRAGYEAAFVLHGPSRPLDAYALPRVDIYRNDSAARAMLKTSVLRETAWSFLDRIDPSRIPSLSLVEPRAGGEHAVGG